MSPRRRWLLGESVQKKIQLWAGPAGCDVCGVRYVKRVYQAHYRCDVVLSILDGWYGESCILRKTQGFCLRKGM